MGASVCFGEGSFSEARGFVASCWARLALVVEAAAPLELQPGVRACSLECLDDDLCLSDEDRIATRFFVFLVFPS